MASHYIMDGGKLNIEDVDKFNDGYIHDILRRKRLCYVERRTPHFKFFIDFDYVNDVDIKSEYIYELVSKCKPYTHGTCYISRASTRRVKEGLKCGVHLHWPDMIVNSQKAIKIRNSIIADVPHYAKYIDASVYNGSGLRMLWSYKFQNDVYYEPYKPWKRITPAGFVMDLPQEPSKSILELFTIRTTEQDEYTANTDLDTDVLESHVRSVMKGYETVRIKKVGRTRNDQGFYIQTDSKYCENIKREHKSNHVWFYITNNTIRSECYDESCKGFKSQGYKLPPSITKDLEKRIPKFLDDYDTIW